MRREVIRLLYTESDTGSSPVSGTKMYAGVAQLVEHHVANVNVRSSSLLTRSKIMKYEIIEDCSPYYIRFTYDGMSEFIKYAQDVYDNFSWENDLSTFRHLMLPILNGKDILSKTPLATDLFLNEKRVSYFYTPPNFYYRAHKDGLTHRYSINYTIKVLDNNCITSWYDDDIELSYKKEYLSGTSRELDGFVKENHTPVKTMVAQPNECILFNTDIYHDWDNRNSSNERVVLTLRATMPARVYYNDVKQILFKGQ